MRLKPPAASADGATPTPSDGKPTVYRAVGSLLSGGLMVVFGLLLALTLAFGSEKHPVGVALGVLLTVAGVIGGLYPTAKSHPDRVEIVNPFRRIVLPWPRVAEISARLSLVVETTPEAGASAGRKYTVWAIPVSMHDRRKADKAMTKQIRDSRTTAMRMAKDNNAVESMLHGGRGSGPMRGRQGVEAIEMMAFVDQAVSEMQDRRRACGTTESEAPPIKVTWTWWSVALFSAAVVGLVLAAVGAF
jgi:hypothetical protein